MRFCGKEHGIRVRTHWFRTGLRVLAAAMLVTGCRTHSTPVHLVLEKRDLQNALARRFPVERASFPIRVILRNPEVILRDGDNRVGLGLEAEVSVPIFKPVRAQAAASGVPRYDSASKAFFLSEPELERLELPGVSVRDLDAINAALATLLGPLLESTPIYTIPDRSFNESAARYLLQEVTVQGGKLHLILSPPPADGPAVAAGAIATVLVLALIGWRIRVRHRRGCSSAQRAHFES